MTAIVDLPIRTGCYSFTARCTFGYLADGAYDYTKHWLASAEMRNIVVTLDGVKTQQARQQADAHWLAIIAEAAAKEEAMVRVRHTILMDIEANAVNADEPPKRFTRYVEQDRAWSKYDREAMWVRPLA